MKNVINFPGNVFSGVCKFGKIVGFGLETFGKGVLSGVEQFGKDAGDFFKNDVGGFFEDVGSEIGSWFGRRKRDALYLPDLESGCNADVIPDLDVNVQGLHANAPDLSQLLEFAKKLRPDMDFDVFDLNLDNLKTLFESQSIAGIREKLMNVVKYVFEYSQVPIKRVVPNKRVGWIFLKK